MEAGLFALTPRSVLYETVWWWKTLRPRQNGHCFPDDICKCIFLNEDVWMPTRISLKFVPKDPTNNIPALVQMMAWCPQGDKPLSEPIMLSLLMHICVTWPQWVKTERQSAGSYRSHQNALFFGKALKLMINILKITFSKLMALWKTTISPLLIHVHRRNCSSALSHQHDWHSTEIKELIALRNHHCFCSQRSRTRSLCLCWVRQPPTSYVCYSIVWVSLCYFCIWLTISSPKETWHQLPSRYGKIRGVSFDPSWPLETSYEIWHHKPWLPLVQVMSCHLFSAMPLFGLRRELEGFSMYICTTREIRALFHDAYTCM